MKERKRKPNIHSAFILTANKQEKSAQKNCIFRKPLNHIACFLVSSHILHLQFSSSHPLYPSQPTIRRSTHHYQLQFDEYQHHVLSEKRKHQKKNETEKQKNK